MKQLRQFVVAGAAMVAAAAAPGSAQTARRVTFVTNSYEVRVEQFSAGSLANGTRYVAFGGDAKAVNGKVAADLKTFAFTVFYDIAPAGVVTINDGTFMIQTINKDRVPLNVGGDILGGATVNLGAGGTLAAGQKLSLALVGSEGTDITGVLTATTDKSSSSRLSGMLSLTYPVVQ